MCALKFRVSSRLFAAGTASRALRLALVLGSAAASFAASIGLPQIASFGEAEIGAGSSTWAITQDRAGVMYFGGHTLLRFDGERWTSTAVPGANTFRDVAFGSDGRLWLAASGDLGWFDFSRDARGEFHSLRAFLPAKDAELGSIWRVFAQPGGATFVSENRILKWDGRAFQVWPMPGGRRLPAMKLGDTVFVYYERHGLYALDATGPTLVIPQEKIGDAAVLWMTEWGSDWLLGTNLGLFIYAKGQAKPFAPDVSARLQKDAFVTGARLPDGRLAFSTSQGGIVLMRADGALDRVLSTETGLPTPSIRSLFVDRDGILWATSTTHVCRIDLNSSTTVFDQRSGLPPQAIRSLAREENKMVIGTDQGIYTLPADGQRVFPFPRSNGAARYLLATNHGILAAGKRGVYQVQGDTITPVYTTKSDVFAVLPSRKLPGEYYFSDNRSVVRQSITGPSQVIVPELPDIAGTLAEDETGRLWIGTAAGVWTIQPNADDGELAAPVSRSIGLPAKLNSTVVCGAPDGSIILLADSGGWIKPRGVDHFSPIEDYPAREISAFTAIASDNTLWIAHSRVGNVPPCIARIAIVAGHAKWQPHAVAALESIGSPRSLFAERLGPESEALWIGGTQALLRHVVTGGPSAVAPRAPLLHAFVRSSAGGSPQALAGPLPYSTRGITFEFAEPEYASRAQLRLETRIEGIDPDWVAAPAEARRELNALRDGRYVFRVRAVAPSGLASAATQLAFVVLPPWWRTFPAMFGASLALLPLGYGSYRLRLRALRRRNTELEAKVRQRTDELEQASAAKTQFVANMSHDIRNPLNGIVGLALALEDTRLDAEQREIVATLRECTTYLSTLVDDVLDFASIEAGRVELRPGPFLPVELLRSIVTTLRTDSAESGATLSVEVDPALPPNLSGDAGRIQQILVNYVSNALKYAGGGIHLSARIPADAPDEVEFSVADQGAGISRDAQSTLFTKFTRLSSHHKDIPGAGLGLASCRLLADIMGGSVGVESSPGNGARFFLRLPLIPAEAPVPPATENLPNTRVLLVEDTNYNAMAATAVLRRLGLTCERAHTGAEALEMFAAHRFNLVLLDRNLPDMDGTEVARKMRAMESDGPPAILLAATAYCTAEDRALCLASGMDAFVGKPLTPEKIRKVLLAAGRRMLTAATFDAVPAPAPKSTPAALDTTMLDYLSDGSRQGLDAQVDRFLAGLGEAEAQLKELAAEQNHSALARCAHQLVGHARMIGAHALADAAGKLERAARSQPAACAGELRAVTIEIEGVTAALRHRRAAALPG